MRLSIQKYLLFPIASVLSTVFLACTETIEFEIENFEDILVIDANITDEVKRQEIFLSTTFLTGEEIVQESGATVRVVDDLENEFIFQETESGSYVSAEVFGAQQGRRYRLFITTADGDRFISEFEELAPNAGIESITAEIAQREDGVEGISILVSSDDLGDGANFFRYDYEETFQVVSPLSANFDLVVASDGSGLERVDKTREEEVCYRTQESNGILITSRENLSQPRILDYEVRFIPQDDFVIRNRYSILVNQYVQSSEAFSFYETLREFSNVESLFTQTQPGFIGGNFTSEGSTSRRVLGVFEVSSVTSARIFVDRNDFFPDEPPPEFGIDCSVLELARTSPFLFDLIANGTHKYANEDFGVYIVAPRSCLDCTVFGSNIVPDFWQE